MEPSSSPVWEEDFIIIINRSKHTYQSRFSVSIRPKPRPQQWGNTLGHYISSKDLISVKISLCPRPHPMRARRCGLDLGIYLLHYVLKTGLKYFSSFKSYAVFSVFKTASEFRDHLNTGRSYLLWSNRKPPCMGHNICEKKQSIP